MKRIRRNTIARTDDRDHFVSGFPVASVIAWNSLTVRVAFAIALNRFQFISVWIKYLVPERYKSPHLTFFSFIGNLLQETYMTKMIAWYTCIHSLIGHRNIHYCQCWWILRCFRYNCILKKHNWRSKKGKIWNGKGTRWKGRIKCN